MGDSYSIEIFENQRPVYSAQFTGVVELGRQTDAEAGPFCATPSRESAQRVVVARREQRDVSRRHVLLRPVTPERLLVENVSSSCPLVVNDKDVLAPGASIELPLPTRVTVGTATIRLVHEGAARSSHLGRLSQPTLRPGAAGPGVEERRAQFTLLDMGDRIDVTSVLELLQDLLVVLQGAATSADFFEQAARSVVEIAGLDSGSVLMRNKDGWEAVGHYRSPEVSAEADQRPSNQVLAEVCRDRKTTWLQPEEHGGDAGSSLRDVRAVVAAPILDAQGEVIGVLYGDRRSSQGVDRRGPIKQIEAMVVDLLAYGVAAGLNRLKQEKATLALRVQFEQFFSPGLSRLIETEPELLDGRQAEVSVLVVDIRGFSRIAARSTPDATLAWIHDMLNALSNCIIEHDGVIVDYVGDEVLAMWGAPVAQPDHATRACRAALDMIRRLPGLSEKWRDRLGEPVSVGIGINTGPALVGNIGSARKFKYGAIGTTVNLASRVQGLTKYLRVPLLVTEATLEQLGDQFASRRLCQVRVVNIPTPVMLYELAAPDAADFAPIQKDYGQALSAFEAGDAEQAVQILGRVFAQRPQDGPALLLMSRAINCMVESPLHFDPVWVPQGK